MLFTKQVVVSETVLLNYIVLILFSMTVMSWHELKQFFKQWRNRYWSSCLRVLDWELQFWLSERECQKWSSSRVKSFWSSIWPLFILEFLKLWNWAHWNDIECSFYERLVTKWLHVDSITWNARNKVESAERYYQLIFVRVMILVIKFLLTRAKIVDWESRLKSHKCDSKLIRMTLIREKEW